MLNEWSDETIMSNTTQMKVIIVLLILFHQALKAHNIPLIHSLLSRQFTCTLVYRKLFRLQVLCTKSS